MQCFQLFSGAPGAGQRRTPGSPCGGRKKPDLARVRNPMAGMPGSGSAALQVVSAGAAGGWSSSSLYITGRPPLLRRPHGNRCRPTTRLNDPRTLRHPYAFHQVQCLGPGTPGVTVWSPVHRNAFAGELSGIAAVSAVNFCRVPQSGVSPIAAPFTWC